MTIVKKLAFGGAEFLSALCNLNKVLFYVVIMIVAQDLSRGSNS